MKAEDWAGKVRLLHLSVDAVFAGWPPLLAAEQARTRRTGMVTSGNAHQGYASHYLVIASGRAFRIKHRQNERPTSVPTLSMPRNIGGCSVIARAGRAELYDDIFEFDNQREGHGVERRLGFRIDHAAIEVNGKILIDIECQEAHAAGIVQMPAEGNVINGSIAYFTARARRKFWFRKPSGFRPASRHLPH